MYRKAQFVEAVAQKQAKEKIQLARTEQKGHREKEGNKTVQSQLSESNGSEVLDKKSMQMVMRRVFLVMSRVHTSLGLKHKTLFLGLALYQKYLDETSNPEEIMPYDVLLVVCVYLAMKYEEIYPPGLKQLLVFIKNNITKE